MSRARASSILTLHQDELWSGKSTPAMIPLLADIRYLDDMLLRGAGELLLMIVYCCLLGGLPWLVCTVLARYVCCQNYLRYFLLLVHFAVPYWLFYVCVVLGIYHEFEEHGQAFEKDRFLDDSFPLFCSCLLLLLIPLYLLRFWRLRGNKDK